MDCSEESHLTTFLEELTEGMGRLERRRALGEYVRAFMLPIERKSIQPMAELVSQESEQSEGLRQRFQQAVTVAKWDERRVFERITTKFCQSTEPEALVIDETGFTKKGTH